MLAMTSQSINGGGGEIADPADWLKQFDQLDVHQEEMRNELNDAQAKGIGNRQKRAINKRVVDARDTLNRLERSLRAMERNPMKAKIGEGELARRAGLLAALRQQYDTLDDQVNTNGGRLGANLARKAPTLAEESAESQAISNQQLLAQQRSALSSQDEKLDGILDGVSRLKVMSHDINQELSLHENILSELDSAVDNTDARLQRNTKRVEIVTEESGGCCGLVTMAILFAIIVMLLVTNWGCKLPKAHCS